MSGAIMSNLIQIIMQLCDIAKKIFRMLYAKNNIKSSYQAKQLTGDMNGTHN